MLTKIYKALESIYTEREREQVKSIKRATSFEDWGDNTTKTTDKQNNYNVVHARLTEKQKQKPLQEQKQILINKVLKNVSKQKAKSIERLQEIEQAESPNHIKITLNWYKSNTWGCCPQGSAWFGYESRRGECYESERIGGCGYDKTSTATADLLNECKGIKKLLLEELEKQPLKTIKHYLSGGDSRGLVGYGVSYYMSNLVSFSGGVGVNCHIDILNKLGYKTTANEEGKTWNFYDFERVERAKRCKSSRV